MATESFSSTQHTMSNTHGILKNEKNEVKTIIFTNHNNEEFYGISNGKKVWYISGQRICSHEKTFNTSLSVKETPVEEWVVINEIQKLIDNYEKLKKYNDSIGEETSQMVMEMLKNFYFFRNLI